MIRAAAKNHAFAVPVVDPVAYDAVLAELRESDCRLSPNTRESLAAEAFAYTARYDTAIARWFQEKREDFPPLFVRAFEKVLELPYGENPHQRAAYYEQVGARTHVLSMVSQLGGKPISFNNLLDLDAGRLLLAEFQIPACVIIKHNNPCGVACGSTAIEAYIKAFACDPQSAFGGIVCLNRGVNGELARALSDQFVELLFARGYDDEALAVLAEKPNTRILDDQERRIPNMIEPHLRQVVGGLLVQDRDFDLEERSEMQVVTERRPTEAEWQQLSFAWRVCKHTKSNGIIIARDLQTIGVGRGADEPRGLGAPGAGQGARRRGGRRCWPPTPTSPSPTVPSWRWTPASPPSSSPAARSATTRRWRRSTRWAGRWCSPAAATSSIDRALPRRPAVAVRGSVRLQPAGPRRRLRARRRDDLGHAQRARCAASTPYEQAVEIFTKILHELSRVGLGAADVIQNRVYVTDISRGDEVGRAHGDFFGEHRPLITMVEVSGLIDPRMLVEIETVAYAGA